MVTIVTGGSLRCTSILYETPAAVAVVLAGADVEADGGGDDDDDDGDDATG